MNYEKNKKYLNDTDGHYYIGIIMVVAGALLFLVGVVGGWFIPYQLYVASAILVIGAIIAFVPSIGTSNEDEFDRYIKKNIDELEEKVKDELLKKDKKQTVEPESVGNYIFDTEGALYRKSRKDGKYRTSVYSATTFVFRKESLYIKNITFSTVNDEKTESTYDIRYDSVPKIDIVSRAHKLTGKTSYTVKIHEIVIKNEEYSITIPVISSVYIDELCEKINIQVKKHTVQ